MEYEREKKKLPGGNVSYHLRRQQEEPEKELTGYEPSEKERQEHTFPKEQLAVETEDGFISGGFVGEKDKNQKVALMTAFDHDAQLGKEEEVLYKERPCRQRIQGKMVLTNSPEPKKSAVYLEMDANKSRERLLSQLEAVMEKGQSQTVSALFPYLKEKETQEQIHVLEEEAREYGRSEEVIRENRLRAAYLRENLQKQEQEKQRLLKLLESRLEQPEEKKVRIPWELLSHTVSTEGAEIEDAEGTETDGADENLPDEKAGAVPEPEIGPAESSVFNV